jgi:O-antigen/teichoic acid export membrane protein/GNAT superfamily N-acetyltransferase
LLASSAAVFAFSILSFALRFIISILIARSLGAAGKGIYTLTLTTAAMLSLVFGLGLPGAMTYLRARQRHPPAELFTLSLLAAALASLAGGAVFYLAFRAVLAQHLLAGLESFHLFILLAILPVSLLASLVNSLLLGGQRVMEYNLVNLANVAANFIFQLISAVLGFGVPGAILSWSLGHVVALLLALIYLRRASGLRMAAPFQAARPALSFGLRSYFASLFTFFNYRLDSYLVNLFSGAAAVGLYSTGVSSAEFLWYLPSAVSVALFPRAASLDAATAGRVSARASRLVLLLALPLAVVFGVAGVYFIPWVYGVAFQASVTAFLWLLPGVVALSVGKIISSGLSGLGKPQYAAYTTGVTVLATITLDIAWIPRWGILGAAAASSTAYLASTLLIAFWFSRESGVSWREIFLPTREDIMISRERLNQTVRAGLRELKRRLLPSTVRRTPPPPQLKMVRSIEPVETIAAPTLPEGYEFVALTPEIQRSWRQLINTCGNFTPLSESYFEQALVHTLLPQGAALVAHAGEVVACISASAMSLVAPDAMLMYLAVHPQHHGKGLGKAVILAAMRAAREQGYPGLAFFTDDHRLPAIRLFLQLGYQPDWANQPGTQPRWEAVLEKLATRQAERRDAA